MSTFNDIAVTSARIHREIENMANGHGNHDGLFDEPMELVRINAHGFHIVTRHYSRASFENELTVAV